MMEFSRIRSTSIEEINEDGEGALVAGYVEEEESPTTQAQAASAVAVVEREHMFDKVVTPSDVGKLNRLVIPKQHAERYFPLDSSSNEKGLLLSFEDSNGKPWRFRYSYWNSSQSYVMTKGWSRFVKEKRLDAGDTVSFGRGLGDAGRDRFFIDWKRRPESHYQLPRGLPRITLPLPLHMASSHSSILSFANSTGEAAVPQTPWGGSRLFVPCSNTTAFDQSYGAYNAQYLYFRSGTATAAALPHAAALQFSGGGTVRGTNAPATVAPTVHDSVPVAHNKAVGKSVRIFGVTLDCPKPDSNDDDDAAPPLQLQLGWAGESSYQHRHHH